MVDTTTPKEVQAPQQQTAMQVLLLNRRLRRMKRRLFLDAVGIDPNTLTSASRRGENSAVVPAQAAATTKALVHQDSIDSTSSLESSGSAAAVDQAE